MADTDEEIA